MYKLGTFIKEFKVQGITLYVRALTVAEYKDLSEQIFLNDSLMKDSFFVRVAYTAIVGWKDPIIIDDDDNIVYNDDGSLYQPEFKEEYIESFDETDLKEVGEFVYYNLSTLTEEEVTKYKGWIRFLFWMSDKKNKMFAKGYECPTCIKNGMDVSKNCGLSQIQKKLIRRNHNLGEIKPVKQIERSKKKLNYSTRKGKKKKKTSKMNFLGFTFEECPISFVDKNIQEWGDILFRCNKDAILFSDGGLADQNNKIYQAQKIVSNEASAIEAERIEAENKKHKR